MSEKDRPLSELSEEEYQETLREISERLGLKILPEDHPIYQEPPTIILNPFPKNDPKEEEDDEQNSESPFSPMVKFLPVTDWEVLNINAILGLRILG